MPHALLLHGRRGIGKQDFARALAEAMLCESNTLEGFSCGNCGSCNWLSQGSHPDFRMIEPEDRNEEGETEYSGEFSIAGRQKKKSRLILIEQIRALGDLISLTSHRHGLRVVLLHPAESLNLNASNALLKMLEEPPPATLFILVTSQLPRILPTIRSRCHKIAMPVPSRSEAESWLETQGVTSPQFCLSQAGGAPLTALDVEKQALRESIETFSAQLSRCARIDPMSSAANWGKEEYAQALSVLQKWIYDLASSCLTSRVRYFPEQISSLQAMSKSVDLPALLDFQRVLAVAQAHENHPLNTELQLEALLVRYSQLFPLLAGK